MIEGRALMETGEGEEAEEEDEEEVNGGTKVGVPGKTRNKDQEGGTRGHPGVTIVTRRVISRGNVPGYNGRCSRTHSWRKNREVGGPAPWGVWDTHGNLW